MIQPSSLTDFAIPENIVYLNCASLSPQLRSVTTAGEAGLLRKCKPWEIRANDWFSEPEELRQLVGSLLHSDAEGIALIPSVSYGIGIAAANLPLKKGQHVLVLDQEYPSNYYAWTELARANDARVITIEKGEGSWTDAILASINEQTAIVAIPNCHWTNGAFIDLEKVSERSHAAGAALVIDASQSLGAYPIDIERIKPDFLVSVGYKWLLGPYGLGYLYASPAWRKEGRPIEYSWMTKNNAENFAQLVNYRDDYRPGARRFDMGEFTGFIHVPMAKAAISQILEWGVPGIQAQLSKITAAIEDKAAALGMQFPSIRNSARVGHMIGLDFPGGLPEKIAEDLRANNIYVGIRGKSIRVAPHLYTRDSDIEKLFGVIRKYIA